MSEVINLNEEFDAWLYQAESSGLKSDRFFEHIENCSTKEKQAELIITWLKAAYLHGVKTAVDDSCRTLAEYSTALEGCDEFQYLASQAYSTAADNLSAYWDFAIKDSK